MPHVVRPRPLHRQAPDHVGERASHLKRGWSNAASAAKRVTASAAVLSPAALLTEADGLEIALSCGERAGLRRLGHTARRRAADQGRERHRESGLPRGARRGGQREARTCERALGPRPHRPRGGPRALAGGPFPRQATGPQVHPPAAPAIHFSLLSSGGPRGTRVLCVLLSHAPPLASCALDHPACSHTRPPRARRCSMAPRSTAPPPLSASAPAVREFIVRARVRPEAPPGSAV